MEYLYSEQNGYFISIKIGNRLTTDVMKRIKKQPIVQILPKKQIQTINYLYTLLSQSPYLFHSPKITNTQAIDDLRQIKQRQKATNMREILLGEFISSPQKNNDKKRVINEFIEHDKKMFQKKLKLSQKIEQSPIKIDERYNKSSSQFISRRKNAQNHNYFVDSQFSNNSSNNSSPKILKIDLELLKQSRYRSQDYSPPGKTKPQLYRRESSIRKTEDNTVRIDINLPSMKSEDFQRFWQRQQHSHDRVLLQQIENDIHRLLSKIYDNHSIDYLSPNSLVHKKKK